MTISAAQGQTFTAIYTPTVNGVPTDLQAAGGSVTRLQVFNGATQLADVGPAVRIASTKYQFTVTPISVIGSFQAVVTYIPFTGATPVVDSDETVNIYAFNGSLGSGATTAMSGSWNYSGDPSASDKDAVRWLVGDIDANDPLLTDGAILFLLDNASTTYGAAADAAEEIAAQFAREVSHSADGVQIGTNELQEKYLLLARRLRARGSKLGVPYVGGISIADKRGVAAETDRAAGSFYLGMGDNRQGSLANEPISPAANETGGAL